MQVFLNPVLEESTAEVVSGRNWNLLQYHFKGGFPFGFLKIINYIFVSWNKRLGVCKVVVCELRVGARSFHQGRYSSGVTFFRRLFLQGTYLSIVVPRIRNDSQTPGTLTDLFI